MDALGGVKAPSGSSDEAVSSRTAVTLMDLPPEIRNNIYGLVLVKREKINLIKLTMYCRTLYAAMAAVENALQQPALTRVSKGVRNETLLTFYGGNTIRTYCDDKDDTVLRWLSSIGPSNRKMLKRFWVECFWPQHVLRYFKKGAYAVHYDDKPAGEGAVMMVKKFISSKEGRPDEGGSANVVFVNNAADVDWTGIDLASLWANC